MAPDVLNQDEGWQASVLFIALLCTFNLQNTVIIVHAMDGNKKSKYTSNKVQVKVVKK